MYFYKDNLQTVSIMAKTNTQFYLAPKGHEDGEYPIRVSVSIHGTRLLTTVGESTKPEYWDNEAKEVSFPQKVTNSHGKTDKQINALLLEIKSGFAKYEANIEKTYKPTVEELRDKLADITGTTRKKVASKREKAEAMAKAQEEEAARLEAEKRAKTVSDYFREFMDNGKKERNWRERTIAMMMALEKRLSSFASMDELNSRKGLNKLRDDMQSEGLLDRTTEKRIKTVITFLMWAASDENKIIEKVCDYRPSFNVKDRTVVYLTTPELLQLLRYEIPSEGTKVTLHTADGKEYEKIVEDSKALAKTRDCFLFSCFSGLRYSDMSQLKKTDIRDNKIHITTQKTSDDLVIELNKYSKGILEKYADCNFPGGLALPVITNQRMNIYLKDLCELAGINEPITMTYSKKGETEKVTSPKYELITTHCARRTFVVFGLSAGIAPSVIMSWTGHKSNASMRPYIDIADIAKEKAMSKFDNLEG